MNVKTTDTRDSQVGRTEATPARINLPAALQEAEQQEEILSEGLGGSLDKVRDLLFGDQVRESDKRIQELEAHLNKGLAELREEMVERVESLGQDLQRQLGKLSEQLLSAEADRVRDSQKMSRRLEEIRSDASRQLLSETKGLVERMEDEHHKTMAHVDRALDGLEAAKTDRNALAQMFTYMASRLEGKKSSP